MDVQGLSAKRRECYSPRYQSVHQSDDHGLNDVAIEHSARARRCIQPPWLTTLGLLFLCVVLTIVAFATVVNTPRESSCIRTTSQPSPLTQDLAIEYHEQRFNGSLLKENVYRLLAGPEVDAAWEALGVNYRSAIVPEDIAESVGLRSDQVKISRDFGGGYPANVEGLHHLHCLNLLRQTLYFNFDYYNAKGQGAFKNKPHILQKHVTHCLDILRQQLMCNVDIGVLGQVWTQLGDAEYPSAYVDFNTKHTCRNFDAVRQWAEERQVPEEPPRDYLAPPKEGARIFRELP